MKYYLPFPEAILHLGVHSIIFLALSPLPPKRSFDLHVLAMPPAFNLSQDQTLQLNIVAQTRPKPLLDSHQKKPIRLTYPCFRRRRNRPVYTLEPKFKRARGGKTSDKALHSLVFIPNIIFGASTCTRMQRHTSVTLLPTYLTTNTLSRARYASVYGVSHSRGGPNCLLVKEVTLTASSDRLSWPPVLVAGKSIARIISLSNCEANTLDQFLHIPARQLISPRSRSLHALSHRQHQCMRSKS